MKLVLPSTEKEFCVLQYGRTQLNKTV